MPPPARTAGGERVGPGRRRGAGRRRGPALVCTPARWPAVVLGRRPGCVLPGGAGLRADSFPDRNRRGRRGGAGRDLRLCPADRRFRLVLGSERLRATGQRRGRLRQHGRGDRGAAGSRCGSARDERDLRLCPVGGWCRELLGPLGPVSTRGLAVLPGDAPRWRRSSSAGELAAHCPGGPCRKTTCACAPRTARFCVRGDNSYGQLGRDQPIDSGQELLPVPGLPAVASLAVGATHACALGRDGEVYCWGHNFFGQLGDGTRDQQHGVVRVVW
jgi:hypothetical protein